MKKLLLLASVLSSGIVLNAQQTSAPALKNNYYEQLNYESIVRNTNPAPARQHRSGSRGSRASVLNSQRIGSAGNLLTIVNGNCNQLDVNDSLNTVIFIHRNDPTGSPGTNVAQYRYDVSKNRGTTWTSDIGPITDDPTIDNVSVNGRFPQAAIFNPTGNTIADSAYLIYNGTWHNGSNGRWVGQMRGRGKINGDLSTYSVHIDQTNNGRVAVAAGFTQGAPGVFWNVNQDYTGGFTGNTFITNGVVVEKGVWNTTTKEVDYTEVVLPATFVTVDNGTNVQSEATSFNIAFDPSGQNGWIFCLGDITADNDSTLEPVYWHTTNGGSTWTGPDQVSLDDVPGVKALLSPTILNGNPASQNPTTSFDADLTVDANGNPHLLTVIGSGDEYAIQSAGYEVWDITYDGNATAGCQWKGIHLAHINTLRGTFSTDNPATTEDNRPLVSRSNDGEKIFFFWNESDIDFVTTPDNDVPNLFGRGLDVTTNKLTPLYNFTLGDSLWGGETVNVQGGVFGGAIFPTVSPTALKNGNTYNIPLVLTQIDYGHDPSNGLGSDGNPAGFWYINNINYSSSDFTINADNIAPTITLNGPDSLIILVNTTYTEQGATAFDCTDGNVQVSTIGTVNSTQIGVYTISYIATDAAGNSDTVTRVVIVGNIPVADFTWNFPVFTYRAKFTDQSLNFPSNWVWTFGDGGGSTTQSPTRNYTANGTYDVCLTASNTFGASSQVCKQVTITGVGIEDVIFDNSISMFPNPTSGKVSIRVSDNISSDLNVSVYNLLGEMLVQPTVYKAGTTNIELNLSGAASGLYYVKVQSTQGISIKSLTLTSGK